MGLRMKIAQLEDTIKRLTKENERIMRINADHCRNSLAAELAKVKELLDLYREAVQIDVKMEGPRFMGAHLSALKRAWDADRSTGGK